MINFNDLKKLDVSKIDVSKIDVSKINVQGILSSVMANKDLLGQVFVIIISLFALMSQVNGYFAASAENNAQLQRLKANEEIISQYTKLQGRVKAFRNGLDKALGVEEFASVIADLAAKHGVQIVQFSPQANSSSPIYTAVGARIAVRAEKYRDLLHFVQGLEKAPYALRVDDCLLDKRGDVPSLNRNTASSGFSAEMTVLSVDIRK